MITTSYYAIPGSDCAGLGTDLLACNKASVAVHHLWTSENDRSVRKLLRKVVGASAKISKNMLKREVEEQSEKIRSLSFSTRRVSVEGKVLRVSALRGSRRVHSGWPPSTPAPEPPKSEAGELGHASHSLTIHRHRYLCDAHQAAHLKQVDLYIAGPPCPPWSSIGSQAAADTHGLGSRAGRGE